MECLYSSLDKVWGNEYFGQGSIPRINQTLDNVYCYSSKFGRINLPFYVICLKLKCVGGASSHNPNMVY